MEKEIYNLNGFPNYEYFTTVDDYSTYLVSNFGNIFNRYKNIIVPQHYTLSRPGGKYYAVSHLYNDSNIPINMRVNRFVLMGFKPQESYKGLEAHHINENTLDNRLSNLMWVTHYENCLEHYKLVNPNIEYQYGENTIIQICELLMQSLSYDEIAKKVFNRDLDSSLKAYISAIRTKKIRKDITSKYNFPIKMRNTALFSDDILEEFCKLIAQGLTNKEIVLQTKNILWDENKYTHDQISRLIVKLRSKKRFNRITDKYF